MPATELKHREHACFVLYSNVFDEVHLLLIMNFTVASKAHRPR